MTAPAQNIESAIDANNRAFEAAVAARDAHAMADVYTTTGMLMPPNSPIIQGKDNVQSFWQQMLDMGIANVKLETVELDQVGDSVNEVGKFTLKDGDGNQIDSGKFIVVWKREDGRWLWHHDIFSSENAAG